GQIIMINENLKLKDYFYCSDLALVTTLSLFYPIKSVDRSQPKRIFFLFKNSKGLDELIKSFWNGILRIEPQKYFNQLKNIKTRIYSGE
ncbi:MAG: DUF5659 domain-containing protein, partial [Candidatus Woesebacteria bacterium]|nr:DUF5659 domain-containing protein [Candidatus Woesebacteria bacterium]